MTKYSATTAVKSAHLRIARATDNMNEVVEFYCNGLGFEVVGRFENHDGFDGVMLGHRSAAYHLEFTSKKGHTAGRAPTKDNLLVFYVPDSEDWRAVTGHIEDQGYPPVESFNPYWDGNGKTYEDPDGYRIVIQNGRWPNKT